MQVCRRGFVTAASCGTLRYKNLRYWNADWGQRVANYNSDYGDSGGVVYTPVSGGIAILRGHVGRVVPSLVLTDDPDNSDYLGMKFYSHIWFMHQGMSEQGHDFIVQR